MSPTRYFWYFAKLPPAERRTIPRATAVEENTPMIVSLEDFHFLFTDMIANPRIREKTIIEIVTSRMPMITPRAIPVRAL